MTIFFISLIQIIFGISLILHPFNESSHLVKFLALVVGFVSLLSGFLDFLIEESDD